MASYFRPPLLLFLSGSLTFSFFLYGLSDILLKASRTSPLPFIGVPLQNPFSFTRLVLSSTECHIRKNRRSHGGFWHVCLKKLAIFGIFPALRRLLYCVMSLRNGIFYFCSLGAIFLGGEYNIFRRLRFSAAELTDRGSFCILTGFCRKMEYLGLLWIEGTSLSG